ncbi:MAG: 30S ribosomal protein S9 [Candidatus Aenigmatarchaeota archaeon]
MAERKKAIQTAGTRKRAVARATIRPGSGRITMNSKALELVEPKYVRMRLREPLMLAPEELVSKVDVDINVKGGGIWGQVDAARTALANALVKWSGSKELRRIYHDYDRTLLVADSRRTEPHKPSRSSAGPRRTKQQSRR